MPIVDAPLVIRLYEPVALSFPLGAPHMPSLDAAVPLPNCLLCKGRASPPGRMGWLSVGGDQAAVLASAGDCAWDCDDAELEANDSSPSSPIAAPRQSPRSSPEGASHGWLHLVGATNGGGGNCPRHTGSPDSALGGGGGSGMGGGSTTASLTALGPSAIAIELKSPLASKLSRRFPLEPLSSKPTPRFLRRTRLATRRWSQRML